MVGAELVDLVNVALVEVVVDCDRRTEGGGPAACGGDSGDSVDPLVSAEEEDLPAVMPHETAELAALPSLHLALGQRPLRCSDVGRHVPSIDAAGTTGPHPQAQQIIAQLWRSVEVVKKQGTVVSCPRLDEVNDRVVKDALRGAVSSLAAEDAEAQEVALGSHGVDLVSDGCWLPMDDSYPRGAALEADHRLVHRELGTGDVVLLEEGLALVVEGRSLLDDGLALTRRDRWYDVEVAVESNEAVSRHELRYVAVAVGGLPVVVQLG